MMFCGSRTSPVMREPLAMGRNTRPAVMPAASHQASMTVLAQGGHGHLAHTGCLCRRVPQRSGDAAAVLHARRQLPMAAVVAKLRHDGRNRPLEGHFENEKSSAR